jgi:hypothetical protein
MSVNFNRAKGKNILNSRVFKQIVVLGNDDPYWDDGINFYPKYQKGFGNCKKKRLQYYQVRRYRTWKYNRKTQYKP